MPRYGTPLVQLYVTMLTFLLWCFTLRPTFRLLQHLPDASISIKTYSNIKIHICIIPMANPANRIPCSTCLTNPPHCIAGCVMYPFIRSILYRLAIPRYSLISISFSYLLHHFPILAYVMVSGTPYSSSLSYLLACKIA